MAGTSTEPGSDSAKMNSDRIVIHSSSWGSIFYFILLNDLYVCLWMLSKMPVSFSVSAIYLTQCTICTVIWHFFTLKSHGFDKGDSSMNLILIDLAFPPSRVCSTTVVENTYTSKRRKTHHFKVILIKQGYIFFIKWGPLGEKQLINISYLDRIKTDNLSNFLYFLNAAAKSVYCSE